MNADKERNNHVTKIGTNARAALRAAFAALAAASCTGCLLPGGARKTYLAEWTGEPPAADVAAARPAVRVGPFTAAEPYASARMLVLDGKTGRLHGTKGAQLATPPAAFVQAAVVRALEKSGAFVAVVDSALAPAGGPSLRGSVEKARLEKRADGSAVYALKVTFAWQDSAGAARRFATCEAEAPARSPRPEDQARAAAEAAGTVASEILARTLR